jgi:D-arabinose 1-dehydrogenase-like Zn-dependent alcohol dehydrogenase
MVLNGITIRGSIVGTRLDLKESLEFANAGQAEGGRQGRTAGEYPATFLLQDVEQVAVVVRPETDVCLVGV